MQGSHTYRLKSALAGVGIALLFCLATIPVTFFATLLLLPLWRWLEETFAIEAIGHSGPAEWCFLFVYIVIFVLVGAAWYMIRQRRQRKCA